MENETEIQVVIKVVRYHGRSFTIRINEKTRTVIATSFDPFIKASAKCSPEDTFDAKIGEQIALYRCACKHALRRSKIELDESVKAHGRYRKNIRLLTDMADEGRYLEKKYGVNHR